MEGIVYILFKIHGILSEKKYIQKYSDSQLSLRNLSSSSRGLQDSLTQVFVRVVGPLHFDVLHILI